LISRTVNGTRPPEVIYALLNNDSDLREAINHLTLWGRQLTQRAGTRKA
jgi:DNA-binding HxlR family transcriptional regulator